MLTLTGKIGQRNVDRSALHFDAAILDELGVVQAKVYDPWVKQELEFQGVWMNDLIEAAKPTSGAQSIHITALDNYQIDLSLADVRAGGILLATKTGDGEPDPDRGRVGRSGSCSSAGSRPARAPTSGSGV